MPRHGRALRRALLGALVAALAAPVSAQAGWLKDTSVVFPSGSFWNSPLRADAPLVKDSNPALADAMKASLVFQGVADPSRPYGDRGGTWFDVSGKGAPTFWAKWDQERVPVILDNPGRWAASLREVLKRGVPIPPDAYGATNNSDATLKIYQSQWRGPLTKGSTALPATVHGKLWELWRVSSPAQNAPGAGPLPWTIRDPETGQMVAAPSHGDSQWHATYGGVVSYTSHSAGYSVDRRGQTENGSFADIAELASIETAAEYDDWERAGMTTSASGLPLTPRALTFADWERGSVDHVLGVSLRDHPCSSDPGTGIKRFVWPAQFASDCNLPSAGYPRAAIPYGQVFRLPADFVIPDDTPKMVRLVLQAARDYGLMFVEGVPAGLSIPMQHKPLAEGEQNPWYAAGAFGPGEEAWRLGKLLATYWDDMEPVTEPGRDDPRRQFLPVR